jgi:O-antigen ligase
MFQKFSRNQIYTMLLGLVASSVLWSTANGNSILFMASSKCIILLGAFFLIDKNIVQKLKNVVANKLALLYIGVYVWYAIWMVFSNDWHNSLAALEHKLVFLVFPIILAGEKRLQKKDVEKIIFYFLISCLVGMVYCECIGLYNYYFVTPLHNVHYIFYELLASPLMHPGYLSNYYLFAIIWLSLPILGYDMQYSLLNWVRAMLIILFLLFLFQLTSKTAFIILLFYVIWFCIKAISLQASAIQKNIIIATASAVIIFFSGFVFLFFKGRFFDSSSIQPISTKTLYAQSIMSRAAALVEGFEKVKPVWYKGYGTGMASEMLQQQLQFKGYTDLVMHHMAPHNQLMRTWLDLGLFGLLFLVTVFIISIKIFVNRKEWAGLWMVIICLINCLTDDMLEIQNGIIFFIFFIGLFLWVKNYANNTPQALA